MIRCANNRFSEQRTAVRIGALRLPCRVARSSQEQQAGLTVGPPLRFGEGMLFPFTAPRMATFAMKTVAYPIDIIFVDAQGRVARIVEGAAPGSRERWSHDATTAVIETRAGWARTHNVSIGTRVAFDAQLPRMPNDQIDEEGAPNRWQNIGTPDDVVEDEADPAHYTESLGWATAGHKIIDPGQLVAAIVEGMSLEERPLDWHRDALKDETRYAVIERDDISRWLDNLPISDDDRNIVEESIQLDMLANAFIILGIAETVNIADGKLVLWNSIA